MKMKNLLKISVLLIAVLFYGCEVQNSSLDGLPGKWKLIESWGGIGGPGEVKMDVKDNVFIEFSANGNLSGSGAIGYERYRLTDSTIVFIRSDNSEQNYRHEFENNRLIMSPGGPMYCIEGCRNVYKKVN